MPPHPAIQKLRQRIASLEDVPRRFAQTVPITESIDHWLPFAGLPVHCIHEVKGATLASAVVFAAILSSRIARDRGNILFISSDRSLYLPGLLPYGVAPDRILHVTAKRPLDRTWAVMEALRCSGVSSVIAFVDDLDLTESRRLQLAAEASGATGFLLGRAAAGSIATPVTRWKISSVKGDPVHRLNEPVWEVDLLYCRGGHPGKWILEWRGGNLQEVLPEQPAYQALG
jgi:protein ImuA